MMKRISMVLVLMAAVAIPVAVADAAPPTAADFAADCADDGQITVTGVRRYVGGDAVLARDCLVVLSADSKVVLRGLSLIGTSLGVTATVPNATVRVVDSTLVFDDFLELTAGCCAGDSDVPENDGTVVVRGSDLVAASIYVNASFDWPNGRVAVRDSRLESTSTEAVFGVTLRASDLAGSAGTVVVARSEIVSSTFALIRTGVDGGTVVRNDVFAVTGSTDVSTGPGGVCITTNNIPSVSCA